jgi:5-methyltetrahydropteroyltriglutamate--homocysteine methyltransferase
MKKVIGPSKLKTQVLGYPRIGAHRELKKACEAFWKGRISEDELQETGRQIRRTNWLTQKDKEIDLIPSNDFSFYDQVLDMCMMMNAIPQRYEDLKDHKSTLYFAMAHGLQKNGKDIIAMEMTKWWDTNYHYIVPEFIKEQQFEFFDDKAVREFREAKTLGIQTVPVLIGPITFLMLGKEKEEHFNRLNLLERLLPAYISLLNTLEKAGAEWVQIEEPYLVTDFTEKVADAYRYAFNRIKESTRLKIILNTYFGDLGNHADLALSLPVECLHLDLIRGPKQIQLLHKIPEDKIFSLGVIDGRNIWKDNLTQSLSYIREAASFLGYDRVIISPSCSFLHIPYDLKLERNEKILPPEIKSWMAFTLQKTEELTTLKDYINNDTEAIKHYVAQKRDLRERGLSLKVHDTKVKNRLSLITDDDYHRQHPYEVRRRIQEKKLSLPLFPTTTIGSFPQTIEVRNWRSKYRKGEVSADAYRKFLKDETIRCIHWQEKIGLDVLVHGEFERNDMVEYFGEQLSGFTFTQNGWVQSYGSRCVKPPIIYGDVSRSHPMTVSWITFAQSQTTKPMKGMLTGPVTILEWSFVRNDQPRSETCKQIALAIRDEVSDLEKAGIGIIQIDEPAIREGLPMRKEEWSGHLKWAVDCFRLASSGVKDETQIHTHMCYSEFNDIITDIAHMDADVITIECSRSQMELLDVFRNFHYPNEIGPGVYDIHSSRVPSVEEIVNLLKKAATFIDPQYLWVNPDCGLKTRGWEETRPSLCNMIEAAKVLRALYPQKRRKE